MRRGETKLPLRGAPDPDTGEMFERFIWRTRIEGFLLAASGPAWTFGERLPRRLETVRAWAEIQTPHPPSDDPGYSFKLLDRALGDALGAQGYLEDPHASYRFEDVEIRRAPPTIGGEPTTMLTLRWSAGP